MLSLISSHRPSVCEHKHCSTPQSGIAHAYRLEPADPRPDEPVTIHVSLGPEIAADRVTCYYTTDGGDPADQRGVAMAGAAVELARTSVVWDTRRALTWPWESVNSTW